MRQKKKVARCHEKIRNQRKDYLHKLSRRITDQYDIVAVEDIDMKAMGQCLHFGKSVKDNGYGMFRNMLDYKLAWKGKKLVKIDRFFPSSKKCSKCGKIKKSWDYPKEYTAARVEMRWTEIEMQRSISVKRQEGCWQYKLSVSGQ